MQSALDSAIGLPSSSTSASWMLGLLMPDEQRRNFTRALAAADRRDHVEPGAGGELGVEPAALPVDVDVDVGSQLGAGLDETVAQAGPPLVQPVDRLVHRRRLDLELAREPGEERRQDRGKVQLGHQATSATVTEVIPGKRPPIWSQLSPSSVLAYSWPVLVPKYRPGSSWPSIAIPSRRTPPYAFSLG